MKEWDGRGGNLDQSSRVQCVVDWFGPTELTTMGVEGDQPGSPVALLIGGPAQENKEKARKASPLTYVDKNSAPFLIMHGDKDNIVPLRQSEIFAAALKKAGVEVTLQVVKGNGHGGPGFLTPESRKLIETFFAKHFRRRAKRRRADIGGCLQWAGRRYNSHMGARCLVDARETYHADHGDGQSDRLGAD